MLGVEGQVVGAGAPARHRCVCMTQTTCQPRASLCIPLAPAPPPPSPPRPTSPRLPVGTRTPHVNLSFGHDSCLRRSTWPSWRSREAGQLQLHASKQVCPYRRLTASATRVRVLQGATPSVRRSPRRTHHTHKSHIPTTRTGIGLSYTHCY